MANDVIHARHLLGHQAGQLRRRLERRAQRRQWRLEAVRQIIKCFLVAGLSRPLLVNQHIEITSDAREFSWVLTFHLGLLTLFDLKNFARHAPQWCQPPSQQQRLGDQQQQSGATQPQPQRDLEGTQFAVKLGFVLQHRKHQWCIPIVDGPPHGVRGSEKGTTCFDFAVRGSWRRQDGVKLPLPSRQTTLKGWIEPQGREGLPLLTLVQIGDVGVQTGGRQ